MEVLMICKYSLYVFNKNFIDSIFSQKLTINKKKKKNVIYIIVVYKL